MQAFDNEKRNKFSYYKKDLRREPVLFLFFTQSIYLPTLLADAGRHSEC